MLEDRICIPDVQSPAFKTFYSFIDCKLNMLLNETQEVFHGLSMEVRVDDDLVKNEDGDDIWYSNNFHSVLLYRKSSYYSQANVLYNHYSLKHPRSDYTIHHFRHYSNPKNILIVK